MNQEFKENVQNYLMPLLMNANYNKELLSNIPHEQIEDLAVAVQLFYPDEKKLYLARVIVNDSLLSDWNLDAKTLFALAYENAARLSPFTFTPMQEVITTLAEQNGFAPPDFELKDAVVADQMYVLTNEMTSYGACAILFPKVMEQVEKKFPNGYYILPSSIHEVIILSKESDMPEQTLAEMVQSINASQVPDNQILSDQIYVYDKEAGRIRSVETSVTGV